MTVAHDDDLPELKRQLADHAEAVAVALFGNVTSRSGGQLRFGRKGSKSVTVSGEGRGGFYDHEAQRGGSMLDAICIGLGCDFVGAIKWARDFLGTDDRRRFTPAPRAQHRDERDDDMARVAKARRIAGEARPLRSTAGEHYLRSRAIQAERWPDTVRWHPRHQAVVFLSTAADGGVRSVQLVYLDADGGVRRRDDGSKLKISHGRLAGAAVRFPGAADAPLVLAEGPETALSVWWSCGLETWSLLGGIGRADLAAVPRERIIVVARDDDARNATSNKPLNDALRRWRSEGRTVLEATPWARSREDKSDFNDALAQLGPDHVRERINAVLEPLHTKPAADARPNLAKARGQLARDLAGAVRECGNWCADDGTEPPARVLRVGLGVGKTEEALRQAVALIREGRAAAGPVVVAVPTHDLGAELLDRAKEIARKTGVELSVACWRGREADDPAAPGHKMCRDLEAVRDAQRISADPQTAVCRRELEDGTVFECPYFANCAYQRQREQRADLWLVAHASIFIGRPAAIPAAPSLLVIDESFLQAGIAGPVLVTPEELHPVATVRRRRDGATDAAGTADLEAELRPLRRKLQAVLEQAPFGPLERERLIGVGLDAEACSRAASHEWKRKVPTDALRPGLNAGERRRILAELLDNASLARVARLWRVLADFLADPEATLCGRAEVVEEIDEAKGSRYRAVRLRWRASIGEGWRAPVIHLDATADLELVRAFLPNAELVGEVEAATPHARVVQLVGKSFSHAAFANGRLGPEVLTFATRQAQELGGKGLVVVPKAVEEALRAAGPVPAYLELAHFGALRGRDAWRGVRFVVIAGRLMPPPKAVEELAGALTGRAVTPLTGWYPSARAVMQTASGEAVTVRLEQHPEPTAEAVRRAVCEAELAQAVGRVRAVDRNAATPVEVFILGDVPVPGLKVDAFEVWQHPSLRDRHLAAGAWLSSAGDTARAYGMTLRAVEGQRGREGARTPPVPYRESLIGERGSPWLQRATYQLAGAGRREQLVVYDPELVPDARAWLEARLGPLADFWPSEAVEEAEQLPAPAPELPSVPIMVPPAPATPAWPEAGRLPDQWRTWARGRIRTSGARQEDVAKAAGLSRPQLANALAGRFGLSPEAAARVWEVLVGLPERQAALGLIT